MLKYQFFVKITLLEGTGQDSNYTGNYRGKWHRGVWQSRDKEGMLYKFDNLLYGSVESCI